MPAPGDGSDLAQRQLRQACADLSGRLRAGESARAETYLSTLPALAADADLALELIYTEFVVNGPARPLEKS